MHVNYENEGWRAAFEDASRTALADASAQSGRLTVQGSPAAVGTWAALAAESAGHRLLELDLDGWEPEAEDLLTFARYLASPDEEENASSEALHRLAAGQGAFQAAMLSLRRGLAVAPPMPAAISRKVFADTLTAWSSERAVVVVTADGDLLPEPLRRTLAEVAAQSGGGLTWLDGTRGVRPASRRLVPGLPEVAASNALDRLLTVSDQSARRLLEEMVLIDAPVPLELLIERTAPGAAAREALTDLVDDLLVDELSLVADLGFRHPTFNQAIYCAADPLLTWHLRQSLDDVPGRAAELLAHFRPRLPPRSRATTCLLLRLSGLAHGPQSPNTTHLLKRLSWWLPAQELRPDLDAAGEAGDVSDETLADLGSDAVLAPELRLVMSTAREQLGVPPKEVGRFLLQRARALSDSGKSLDALEAASQSLEWNLLNHGRRSEPFLNAQATCAQLLADVGERTKARDELRAARLLASEILAADDPRHVLLATDLGQVLIAIGELRAARLPLEEALELATKLFGEDDSKTVSRGNNLAALLIDLGELEAARDHLRAAHRAARRAGLPPTLCLGLLHNLQLVASRLGEGEREAAEARLEASEELFGEEHPDLVPLLAQIAELCRSEGDFDAASTVLKRAISLAESHVDEGDPVRLRLAEQLARLGTEAREAPPVS